MPPPKEELLKRKKMTAHAWKSRFKRQRTHEVETELELSGRQSHICSNYSIGIAPKPLMRTAHVDDLPISGVVGILKDKSIAKISDGPLEKCSDSNLKDNVVVKPLGRDGLENLMINSASRKTLDDSERLPTSGSLLKKKISSKPESVTCLGGFQVALNSEHHENETLSAKSENCGLVVACITCSKEKSAHEKELSSCNVTAHMEMDGSSSSKQKLASKGDSTEDEINYDIMEIQRLCNKRMKKLKREQQRDLQNWKEEKLRLENDHKLEAAMIRCVYSEGSTRSSKLKLLESDFEKKMEELDTRFKYMEVQHQSAMSVERLKAAQWLGEIKALCSSEQTATVCGAKSLGSQSKENGECSRASELKEDGECSPASQPKKDGECSPASELKEDGECSPASQSKEDGECSPASQSKEDGECSPDSEQKEDGEAMDTNVTTWCLAVNHSNQAMSMQGNGVEPFDQPKDDSECSPATEPKKDGECSPATEPKKDGECSPATEPEEDGECSAASESKKDGEAIDADVTTQRMAVSSSNKSMPMQGNGIEPFDQTNEDDECSPASEPQEDVEYSPARQHIVEAMNTDVTTQRMAGNDSTKAVSVQENEVEPFDQTGHLNPCEIVCSKLPASEKQVCNKMQPVESNVGVPLDVLEIVDNVNPMEFSNGPNKQHATVFADSLENQGGDSNEPNTADSPMAGQVSQHSEQREAMLNHFGSLTLQVSEDQVHRNLVSANPQENSSPIEVANCELDTTGTHVQQCLLPIHASPIAEPVEILVLPPESLVCANSQDDNLPIPEGQDIPQIEVGNLELDIATYHVLPQAEEHRAENCEQQHLASTDASASCNPSPTTDVEHQIHNSGRNSSQTAEGEDAFVLPLESSPQIVGNNAHWLKNPLENELERICKETQHFEQSYKDMISHLKSDCEKETQEMVTQIRRKFDAKLKDAETELRLKKNEFHKKRDKVLMNKLLANVLKIQLAQCISGFPGRPQGNPSSHMQNQHQPSIQQSVRLASGPDILQPPSNVQVPSPTPQLMQQIVVTHPTCQNIAACHVPADQHAMHLSQASSSRPLIISSARNPYMMGMGVNRSPAPHLRPTAASSAMPPVLHQPLQSLQPLPVPRSMPATRQHNPQQVLNLYQNQATLQNGLIALSARNFEADINPQQTMPWYGTTPSLPEISSTYVSFDPS